MAATFQGGQIVYTTLKNRLLDVYSGGMHVAIVNKLLICHCCLSMCCQGKNARLKLPLYTVTLLCNSFQ